MGNATTTNASHKLKFGHLLLKENIMKRLFVAAAAALSAAAVAVPTIIMGGGPAGASSAAAQFTADRAALTAASGAFVQAFDTWQKSGGAFSQTSSFVNVYVSAIVTEDHKLLDQSWPAAATSDIDAIVRGDAAVEGVVSALPGLNSSASADFFIIYDQDANIAVADANIVRHDLGLPLASSS
jgi:hypothetical protein